MGERGIAHDVYYIVVVSQTCEGEYHYRYRGLILTSIIDNGVCKYLHVTFGFFFQGVQLTISSLIDNFHHLKLIMSSGLGQTPNFW